MNEAIRNEKGLVTVLFALGLMAVLLVCLGLAVDAGHSFVVRRELQHAADAAALAGAANFYPSSASPAPMWSTACSTATGFVGNNKADGRQLQTGEITYGWWNVVANDWKSGSSPVSSGTPVGTAAGVCIGGTVPCTLNTDCPNGACLIQDVPAIMATIAKSDGVNDGPVAAAFTRYLGWNAFSPSSKGSVAVTGAPANLGSGTVLPWAITKCTADQNTATLPSGTVTIGFFSKSPTCQSGQWTSFLNRNNQVPAMSTIGTTGNNPVPVNVGDLIHIAPGTRLNEFGDIPLGDVVFPVVRDDALSAENDTPLLGFVAFHIDHIDYRGVNGTLQGRFVPLEVAPNSRPGGPNYGLYVPPLLVK